MKTSYPIINTNDYEDVRKFRKITLHKEPMSQEIDAHTSKYVEARGAETPQQANAVSSDSNEVLDGTVINRLMDYRDSKLRTFIESFIAEECKLEADNFEYLAPVFKYNLSLPEEFNDANLRPLAILMHKYIVWGSLFDWYCQLGDTNEARNYGAQLEELETDITSMISPAGYAKRPLQPFGPAI